MNTSPSPIQRFLLRLPLRQRMALVTGSLVFVLGALLVLFINLLAPIFITHEVGTPNTEILVQTQDEQGNPITILAETPAPEGYTIFHDPGLIRADPLTVVRLLSIAGLLILAGLDFWLVRWLVRGMLRPIDNISQAARQISAQTLDQHLNYQGAADEVKDLADAFDTMLVRLENNFQQQGQFVSNLAHELRTPLTSMRMNFEVMRADPQVTLEDYHEMAATMERSLTRLEYLIENLLLLAKGEMEIAHQTIVLGVLFEEILEDLSPIAQEREVTLSAKGDFDLTVQGDAVLLQRAFYNLIENGIRYNRPNGFVEISCEKDQNLVKVVVRDNGLGISAADQAYIFQRFYRSAEAVASDPSNGNGLGLAIASHILELHQGRIQVASRPGAGSTFTIFLPVV